jgi:hypothetical protein
MAPQELYYDIGNLTDDDTDQLASLASWRARLFGKTKRLRKQVPRLLLLSRPGILGSRFCPVFGGLSLHFVEGFLRWPFGGSAYPPKNSDGGAHRKVGPLSAPPHYQELISSIGGGKDRSSMQSRSREGSAPWRASALRGRDRQDLKEIKR